jgi:hypothetical protein
LKIKHLASGINVAPMLWALHSHPELWDQNTARTEHPSSPHYGLSDIWTRYAAPGVDGSQPHDSVWYPCADLMPVRDLVYPLMSMVEGDHLGGVLITKIPAGKMCKPHTDPGWHARRYQKFGIQIQAHPKQAFHFEGESLVTKPGDLFWFDNAFKHWVTNDSDQDRITMIVCIRTDKEV